VRAHTGSVRFGGLGVDAPSKSSSYSGSSGFLPLLSLARQQLLESVLSGTAKAPNDVTKLAAVSLGQDAVLEAPTVGGELPWLRTSLET
jgi:hypothetical protein